MREIRFKHSLEFKSFVCISFAFLIAVAVFVFCFVTGGAAYERIINSDEEVNARRNKQLATFSSFVEKNEISSLDREKMQDWCAKNNYNIFMHYADTTIIITDDTVENYDIPLYLAQFVVAPVSFTDETVDVSVIGFFDNISYSAVAVVAFIIAAVVFLTIVFVYFRKILKRIFSLSEEVMDIRNGKLDHEIDAKGSDELSLLASNVNKMRISIIKHYEAEQHALKSNTELLTSISHDIRTPLTALTGYAEIMADEQITDIEEMRKYACICRDKSYQLKELTDTLFRYFLVYGEADIEPKFKDYSLPELITNVIDNHVDYLKKRGYFVKYEKNIPETCVIHTDIMFQKRMFDNIFSNISKYAQKEGVIVDINVEGDTVVINCENRIDRTVSTAESSGIGLKSCNKIASILDGKISYHERNGFFYTTVSFKINA